MIVTGKNESEAKKFAKDYSEKHPDLYVTLFSCFGIFLNTSKRLNVFAPSDALFCVYWFNGKEKPFTAKQKIADERATPTLQ
jgi:hypothetical protein